MSDFDDLRDELKDIKRDIQTIQITAARTEEQLSGLKRAVNMLQQELGRDFVSIESFEPVRNFVYGTVAIIATGFLGAIITLLQWGK
jgi:chromosome segregation ATPase